MAFGRLKQALTSELDVNIVQLNALYNYTPDASLFAIGAAFKQ